MLDVDTLLTALYVITDDFCQSHRPKKRPGPKASLSESEVLTLAIFAHFSRFTSERDFYRYAKSNLRGAFPTLPERSQFNRCVRSHVGLIEKAAIHAPGVDDEGPEVSLRSARRLGDARPGRQEKRRGMAGRLRRHRMV